MILQTHPTIALIFNSKVRFWSVDTLRKVALEFEIWVMVSSFRSLSLTGERVCEMKRRGPVFRTLNEGDNLAIRLLIARMKATCLLTPGMGSSPDVHSLFLFTCWPFRRRWRTAGASFCTREGAISLWRGRRERVWWWECAWRDREGWWTRTGRASQHVYRLSFYCFASVPLLAFEKCSYTFRFQDSVYNSIIQ